MQILTELGQLIGGQLTVIEILRRRTIGVLQRMVVRKRSDLGGVDDTVLEQATQTEPAFESALESTRVLLAPLLSLLTELDRKSTRLNSSH